MSNDRSPRTRRAASRIVARLVGALVLLSVTSDPGMAQESAPADGLRILSLNIAGLSKPDWGNVTPEKIKSTGEVGDAAREDAELIRDAFHDYLLDRSRTSSRQDQRVVFAHTEASEATPRMVAKYDPRFHAGNCVYIGSPHPTVETETDFLGTSSFLTEFQGFDCRKQVDPKIWQGKQGNSFSTNAPNADYFEMTVPNQCHRLGVQWARFAYGPGPGEWVWVVNAHLSLNPHRAAQAVDEVLAELEATLRARGEWEDATVLFVGDFNVAHQGIDLDPNHPVRNSWYQDICSKKDEDGNETSETFLRVYESDHIEASAFIEARFADAGFVHLVDPSLPTGPSEHRTRKIDYAFLRNAPAGGWSYGHLLRPEFPAWFHELEASEAEPGEPPTAVHWTDHFGIEIVVRPFQVDQAWLVTQ